MLVEQHANNMKNLIAEITKSVAAIKGCQFVSFVYLSKSRNELARHVLNIGFNYHKAVEKSVTELEILMAENVNSWSELQKLAATNVMASLRKTLDAHSRGEQNADYTKKGQYIPFANGLNINTNDNTVQLFGLSHSKTVLVEGDNKPDTRRPLTKAQDEIRSQLTVGKFRELALDESQVAQVKVNGDTLEFVPALQFAG